MAGPRSHIGQEISPRQVRPDGSLTHPRSYGVYSLPSNVGATRRYRFGNYPIRLQELEREYGSCKLEHLFLSRSDALAKAALLNEGEA